MNIKVHTKSRILTILLVSL